MKIRTNLNPSQLKSVGLGLQKLAEAQTSEIVAENPAEQEIFRQIDAMFDVMANSLQDEVSRILLDKED
ncbi:MAG: hypothetical protein EBS53_00415 [Bacteroidetes bacterium]|jgi:hypothetical protein|nr:hypothetical protein [Bacteroidota bacterium]